ncbi:MAG: hypothetical protein KDD68_19375, partial [Bdellovibrionales bacterium]|nr:hypothetical protein [Bdellovibrionales bacterium]
CHVPGGLGKGTFSDSNLTVAWRSFEVTGFSKISEYAVNPSHQTPYTGSHHTDTIDNLREVWVKGLEEAQTICEGGDFVEIEAEGPRIRTRSQGINANFNSGQAVTLTWNLQNDLIDDPEVNLPNLPGAIFEARVSVMDIEGNKAYVISQPRIRNGSTDIHVKSVRFLMNGQELKGNSTFNLVDVGVRAGVNTLLSSGANVVAATAGYSDVLAVSFLELEQPAEPIPPPATGPTVSFSSISSTTPESGTANVTVTLSEPSTRYVTVTLRVNQQTTATPVCCIDNFTNEAQTQISINHFDWDYKMGNLSVVFDPGQTSKTFQIQIANDQRDEGNSETLVLDLDAGGTINATIGSQSRHTLVIQDDDDPYLGAALTYTQLMRPQGILYVNCLGCHNSVDNEGGYDITNWQLMIDNNILIPYNINSKAFVRMNSEIPGLPPMPFTGLLETEKRRSVQDWIMTGAQNN